jgi:hypothetical protein
MEDRAVIVEGAAAFQAPCAGDRSDAACRMHIDRAVPRTRESIAETKIGALVVADELGESFNGFHRRSGDPRCPLRIARAQMFGQFARRVGISLEIVPIGFVVAEQAMHHRAGERAVGTRANEYRQVRLPHGSVHVNIDGDDLGTALLAGAGGVGHHINLGIHRVGAPDHDQVGFRHLARVGAREEASAGDKAGPGRIDADGGNEAGIFLGVPQPMDAVAHHIAHRAGIQIWPHGLGTVGLFGMDELFGHAIERLVPRDRNELATALRASSPQRLLQAIGMMHAFRITRDLRADHASGIGIVLGAADATDGVVAENLDLERAGRWAIVRTDGREEAGADGLIHRERSLPPSGHGEQCRSSPAQRPQRD